MWYSNVNGKQLHTFSTGVVGDILSVSGDTFTSYYGEHLVLLAQTLGQNTCWVGLSYSKVPGTYVLDEGEKIACYIALGFY